MKKTNIFFLVFILGVLFSVLVPVIGYFVVADLTPIWYPYNRVVKKGAIYGTTVGSALGLFLYFHCVVEVLKYL